MARWYFGGQLLEMSLVLKGIVCGRMNLFCLVLTCHVKIIVILKSDKANISLCFALIYLFIISKHFMLRADYCARQYPKIMKYGSYFHRTRGVVRTKVCVALHRAEEVTG